jgi:hypothetical protein
MNRTKPESGELVKLVCRFSGQNAVLVGNIPDDDGSREFAQGTLALVLGLGNVDENHDGSTITPLILVDGFTGWIYNDEWEPVGDP